MFIQRVQSVGIPLCFYLKHVHLPSHLNTHPMFKSLSGSSPI
jgi:hypothetical protein